MKSYIYQNPKAFTLVELLVVIGVIALLLGFLMPALRKARSQAKELLCRNQMRQWGLVFEAYSAANDSYYPHIDGTDRSNSDQANNYGWIDVLPPLMGEKGWRDYPYYQKPGVGTIFQCPMAKCAPESKYGYRIKRRGYFSIAMNSCLELDKNCWPPSFPHPDPGGATNDMPSFLQTSKIQNPGRVILLFDQLLDPDKGYGGTRYNRSAGKYCGAYPRDFSARHSRNRQGLGGLVLYCDYHVEWVKTVWKDQWPDDLEVPPGNDKDWFPY